MNNLTKTIKVSILTVTLALIPLHADAQGNTKLDTMQCHIIGFNVGAICPSAQLSNVHFPDGTTSKNATMSSLYKAPWLDFGVNTHYKYKSNWLVSINADFWFGNDNLQNKEERMHNIYTSEGIIIGGNGADAVVTAYNRGLSLKIGGGKIFPLFPNKNPNSGILVQLSGGVMQHQSIFMKNEEKAPQLDGDYALLYDHQRRGFMLSEGIGYWFMSNNSNYYNFYVAFEISQYWSHSTRDYMIDDYLGLSGKDNNKYFDLTYSIKLCWMFPLTGRTTSEYYYY